MEKAAQNFFHLLPFKKSLKGNFQYKEKSPRGKKIFISNVLGRKAFVLSHFNSKHSLIYEVFSFLSSLSTFVIFSPFSQFFQICGSIFTLFHFSFLPFKVKEGLEIE